MSAPASYGRRGAAPPVRLMIVDDSIVARSVVQGIVAAHPDFEVVASASTAEQALARLDRQDVDVVLLDLAMPGMDGLSALPEIIRRGRGARVLVVSAAAGAGADACVRALTLGAADTLEKPQAGFGDPFRLALLDKLRRIAAEVPPRDPVVVEPAAPPPPVPLRDPVAGPVACVGVGASTGGLPALSAFFRALPPRCTAPVLVTQHLPASFMSYFATQLGDLAARPIAVATDGAPLRPGHVLVAPGDAHLRVVRDGGEARVLLDRTPAASGCLPSVDPMLASVADLFGAAAVAVILTGMGRDGSLGARRLVAAGGEVLAQDRASAVVWGMPGAVARDGLATTVAEPALLARRIAERVAAR